MNFFIFVIGVLVAIHDVTKVYGRSAFESDNSGNENNNDLMQEEIPWLSMLKRDEIASMATRALEHSETDFLLKEIISILGKNIKEDFVRILTDFTKHENDMIGIILSKLALKTTNNCPRLSNAMTPAQRITLKILYPIAKMLYADEVLKKLSNSDQQVLKLVEQNVKTNAQLLC